jgi:hypothetical protein
MHGATIKADTGVWKQESSSYFKDNVLWKRLVDLPQDGLRYE